MKKLFIKLARLLGYEIIDQNSFSSPTLNKKLNEDLSTLNQKSIVLPLGEVKISRNKGAGGHNGVKSVISAIGSGFVRFRLGIGPNLNPEVNLADYVLSKLSLTEWALLQTRKDCFFQSLFNLLDDGVDVAMNIINQTNRSPKPT